MHGCEEQVVKRPIATRIQLRGGFAVGGVGEERRHQCQRFGGSEARLRKGWWEGYGEGLGRFPGEAHLCDDLLSLVDGDVGNEQTYHAFALPWRRLGILPELGKLLWESDNLLTFLRIDAMRIALLEMGFRLLRLGQFPQLQIPLGFQDLCD